MVTTAPWTINDNIIRSDAYERYKTLTIWDNIDDVFVIVLWLHYLHGSNIGHQCWNTLKRNLEQMPYLMLKEIAELLPRCNRWRYLMECNSKIFHYKWFHDCTQIGSCKQWMSYIEKGLPWQKAKWCQKWNVPGFHVI